MKSITASDRKSLIRLAASLPKGDENRRAILAGLRNKTSAQGYGLGIVYVGEKVYVDPESKIGKERLAGVVTSVDKTGMNFEVTWSDKSRGGFASKEQLKLAR
jgi:hypothetical protein